MTTFTVAFQTPKTLRHFLFLHHFPIPLPKSSTFSCNNNHNFNNNTIPKPKKPFAISSYSSSSSAISEPKTPFATPISCNNNGSFNNFNIAETEREFEIEPRYLSCSMADKKPLKVAVLLSGGVDSSVALRLLHAAGHSCTAFYLKIWFQEDFKNFWSECPWEADLKYARAVCDQAEIIDIVRGTHFRIYNIKTEFRFESVLSTAKVDVPLEVVHLTDEYWDTVVSYMIAEYRCGRTPNPDILCNTRIKFGAFMDAISAMEFDYVASGHYASVTHSSSDNTTEPSVLQLSKDMVKDQTYFLSHLSQEQLKRLIFPLGCIPKEEVRGIAKALNLPNKDRKDSQGICFLGKLKFSEFVARQIGEEFGPILEAETGDFLGKHRGFWFHTVGQRQGLRLSGGPWYVVEKDVKNNVVFVSRSYNTNKRRRLFRVGSLKWISGSPPAQFNDIQCKVRHGPEIYNCTLTVEVEENGDEVGVVQLAGDDQGLAAGQFAAFYNSNTCLGSGVILESWDDQGFPVCARALAVANMKDRSKLGKPVKIYNTK